jgi:hypothetical protein
VKFLLVVTVCSWAKMECGEDRTIGAYNSYYDCATAGYLNGMQITRDFGKENAEKLKVIVQFDCVEATNT